MRIYRWETRHGEYVLVLNFIRYSSSGRRRVQYSFGKAGEGQIFSGNQYGHAFLEPEGPQAAQDLMGWLTLRPGDTDAEYFDGYTPRQMKFALEEAEELGLEVEAWFEELTELS